MSNQSGAQGAPSWVEDRVARWHQAGDHYARDLLARPTPTDPEERARTVELLLELNAWPQARQVVLTWLMEWLDALPERGKPDAGMSEALWRCLADVSERSHDGQLLELFWQGLGRLRPQAAPAGVLPLVGVPILNGEEHLQQLLASLDVPIEVLAIVDQSGGRRDAASLKLRRTLQKLEREGQPGIGQIRVARPFANAGVAAAWNQILLSFPRASMALIVNHDVVFPPGVLAEALALLNPDQPQYLALFPGDRAFSAFLLTALAWDAVGRFDERYYPAYCEDLDYRDRLLATPSVQRLNGSFTHGRMLSRNPLQSRTLADDPALARHNRRSFALNRLWYSFRRRGPGSAWLASGLWRQRWLGEWD